MVYLLPLLVDSSYVTVYSKDTEVHNMLNQNAIEKGFQNIGYVTNEHDPKKVTTIVVTLPRTDSVSSL